MARTCSICSHPQRSAIDRALVAGTSYRDIAGQFRVSRSALERHKDGHLPAKLVKAAEAHELAEADGLLGEVKALQTRAVAILDKAEKAGELRAACSAIREARGCLELQAKLLGELDERPQINVLVSPDWQRLRSIILEALEPFGEARLAVAAALGKVEHVDGGNAG